MVTSVSGSGLIGLETCLSTKKKHVDNIYFHSISYKKLKKSVVGNIVDSSADPLNLADIGGTDGKPVSSISSLSNLENMKNTVAKKTSYVNSDNSISNKNMVNGFGEASAPSKFSEIIKSSFTLEISLNKIKEMAICKKILVNNDFRKPNSHLNREIIVKEITVNLSKLAVKSVFSKFSKMTLVEFEFSDVVSLTLFYILPVGTFAHDFFSLLELYDRKMCFIGHNLGSYIYNKCTVICFDSLTSKLAAIGSVPVFKSVNLQWAGLFLACCALCKQFDYILNDCFLNRNSGVCGRWVVTAQDQICLANIYKKKQAPIACPVFFGGKTWAQVADSFFSCVVSSFFSDAGSSSGLLVDQVSGILRKLRFIELVSLVSSFLVLLLVAFAFLDSGLNLDMTVDGVLAPSVSPITGINVDISGFSSSSSKVLTTKMSNLESKIVVLDVSVNLVLVFISGLNSGYLGFGVVIIMDNSLAKHIFNAIVVHSVANVGDYFDTDYNTVYVFVGLGGLLDM
ncbi:hypothetical protein G9A89_005271 [Geosiphon pyriformis]|nr:hypothetical protein G9A89_005271 [Geosiphon pyriformis]